MRKGAIIQKQIVSAGDASQATVISSVVGIEFLDNIGIQINVTSGTPTGVFTVEVSIDHSEINGNVLVAGNWIAISLPVSASISSGSPANIFLDLNQLSAPWIRLKYTKSGGTGNFDAFLCGKMI